MRSTCTNPRSRSSSRMALLVPLLLLLVFFYSLTTANALLTPSSLVYILQHTRWNLLNGRCGVGQFAEPDTAITMAVTDAFSQYIGVTFPHDGVIKIEASLPFALYSIFTSYTDDAKEIPNNGALLDSEIILDSEGPNPYVAGNPIDTEDRSYTIYASKTKPDFVDAKNWLSTDSGNDERVSVFVMRVVGEYGNEQGLSTSRDWVPRVTLIDADTGRRERCGLFLEQGRLPHIGLDDTYTNPLVMQETCRIYDGNVFPDFSFYPIGKANANVGFANTAQGGYVMADLNYGGGNDATKAFVVEIKKPPRVYDPSSMQEAAASKDDAAAAVFQGDEDVRYTSMCLYANLVSNWNRGVNCVLGQDIYAMYEQYGSAFVAGGDSSLREHFEERGIPFLELVGSEFGSDQLGRYPKIAYRVQLPNNPDFLVPNHVPQWDGMCEDKVADGFYKADNEENWGDFAPVGRQCSTQDLLDTGCGFEALEAILKESGDGM